MSTPCRTIQMLEACDDCNDLTVEDPTASPSTEEGGTVVLQIGVTEYAVVFGTEKVNAEYEFIEDDISNEVDGEDQLEIGYVMDERTVSGFRLLLDALPDTVNYRFNWTVRIDAMS